MYFQLIAFLTLVFSMRIEGEIMGNPNWSQELQSKCDLTTKPQCSSDCSSILVCLAGNENPALSIKCHSNTPYCDKGTCTTMPGSCKSNKYTSNFICTSSGIFPEPTDCTRHHFCTKSGLPSTEYKCPSGSIFNSKLKLCQRGLPRIGHLSRKVCEKISCDKVENEFITFPANPAFYAFCSVSNFGVRQVYMYKCDNEEDQIFDVKTRSCIFNCKSAGYFPDSVNCNIYYICSGIRTFNVRQMNCPPGFYFNGTACINSYHHCLPGSLIATAMPSHTQSTTQEPTIVSITESPNGTTSLMPETFAQSTTDFSTQKYTSATLPAVNVPYPSILFLSCPLWVKNDRICLGIGRLLHYGKRGGS